MSSRHFHELIDECKKIHDKKSHDYSQEDDPFSNFKRAAELASWFKSDNDKVFVTLIGIKLARLAELFGGKLPNNESIKDSFIDLSNYCLLWGSSYLSELEEIGHSPKDKVSTSPFVCNGCGRQFQDRDPIITPSGFYCSIACQYPIKENA